MNNSQALNIVTMANDIGRTHPFTLRKAFEVYYNSISRHNQNFTIHLYTNLPKHWFTRDKVKVYDSSEQDFLTLYKGNRWFNLTFHRFFLLEKHLLMGDNPTWIDLDTIICDNIEFLADYPNMFIKYGFGENVVTIDSQHARPQKEWMHGHLFKIDQTIVGWIKEILAKGEDIPTYEIMSFFTLLEMQHPEHFNILNRITNKLINSQWCYDPYRVVEKPNSLTNQHFHEEPRLIKDRIQLINGRLYGYDGPPQAGGKLCEFMIMTFTFFPLEANLRQNWSTIIDPGAREWLRKICPVSVSDRLRFYLIHWRYSLRRDNLKKKPVLRPIIRMLQKIL